MNGLLCGQMGLILIRGCGMLNYSPTERSALQSLEPAKISPYKAKRTLQVDVDSVKGIELGRYSAYSESL